jgi:uncharacterized protein (TIGR00299 family) protein
VPAPAVAELLKGVPVYQPGEETGELTTPTGAVILRELVRDFAPMPEMRIDRVGYGAGSRVTGAPNALRLFLGETVGAGECASGVRVAVIETNIDDMNPELYGYAMERLYAAGALDVFLSPIQMKKNRPATLLSVIAPPDSVSALAEIVLTETTSLGVRYSEMNRICLDREVRPVRTRFGVIPVKLGKLRGKTVTVAPEYEACRAAARRHRVPLKTVYEHALRATRDA